MSDDGSRRFTIADVLILVAGVALGLGLMRTVSPDLTPERVWEAIVDLRGKWSAWHAFVFVLDFGMFLAAPFVAGWGPACLVLQVFGSRPRWRRLRRRPGFIACLIATAVVIPVLVIAQVCVWLSIWEVGDMFSKHMRVALPSSVAIGSGVLWSWIAMRLCGADRPGPEWWDRLGRLTGALWIILGAMGIVYSFMALN